MSDHAPRSIDSLDEIESLVSEFPNLSSLEKTRALNRLRAFLESTPRMSREDRRRAYAILIQRPDNGLKSRRFLRLRSRLGCRHSELGSLENGLRTSLWRYVGFPLVSSPLSGRCSYTIPTGGRRGREG